MSFSLQVGPLVCEPKAIPHDCNDQEVGDACEVLGEDLKVLHGSCALVEESVSQAVCWNQFDSRPRLRSTFVD